MKPSHMAILAAISTMQFKMEDKELMKLLVIHYAGSEKAELTPQHMFKMGADFGEDPMECLNWVFTNSLPFKHFERAKVILNIQDQVVAS